MALYGLVTLCLMVASTQALWWGRGSRVASANGAAIDQNCLNLADQGSCEFYGCFEDRLGCGREWYIVRHGQYYCNKMQRLKENFNEAGQRFLEDAQRCMTQRLKNVYQRDMVDCHALEHSAVENTTACFTDNAFCSVFRDNSEHFMDIYEFSDMFTRSSGKLWRAVTALGTRCTAEYIRDLASDASSHIREGFNQISESVSEHLNNDDN
jgi:hypothetical protein